MHARYSLIVGVASALVTANAQAADMPVKRAAPAVAVAPVVVAYDWTGAYIGLHAGGGWVRSHFLDVTPPRPDRDEGKVSPDGFLGGGQVGYNFQTGTLVLGLEVQGSLGDLSGSSRSDFFRGLNIHNDVDSLVTVAGRAGIAQHNWLWFGKAGGAWGDSDFHFVVRSTGNGFGSASQSRSGWMVGGGLEYGITPNWSAKLEYNYIDFGSETTRVACCRFTETVEQQVHVVMGGFNFRFPLLR
jgi:outer membrane immunogenic protein